ncbi:CobW family GTP-binding protein [Paenibacillus hamazuiensis]|uniref:CobW family GTP-binding protein n=1 Tax=Paenibacillus hamazuiensis TaxID=2936508 RepID=UPI00200DADCD|nr:GTP-binding protein [Paenibacillus hamazuiensis]
MSGIPVFILSGFLGSGKTTLLLRLLDRAKRKNLRAAVLMNELGRMDIDGHLISEHMPGLSLEKLLDGCICCDKKSEVASSMELLLQNNPDVVFVELTGVANPEEVADCLAEPQLMDRTKLKMVITVIDAEYVLDYNSIFAADRELVRTLRRQIEVADLLLVNKCDLVSKHHLMKVGSSIRKYNSAAPMHFTVQNDIDLQALLHGIEPAVTGPAAPKVTFKALKTVHSAPHNHDDHQQHKNHERSHSRLQTVTLPCPADRSTDPKRIDLFLKKSEDRILRAKGYFHLQPNTDTHLMQYAGKKANWQPAAYFGQPYLVVIGIDMDTEKLKDNWLRLWEQ